MFLRSFVLCVCTVMNEEEIDGWWDCSAVAVTGHSANRNSFSWSNDIVVIQKAIAYDQLIW